MYMDNPGKSCGVYRHPSHCFRTHVTQHWPAKCNVRCHRCEARLHSPGRVPGHTYLATVPCSCQNVWSIGKGPIAHICNPGPTHTLSKQPTHRQSLQAICVPPIQVSHLVHTQQRPLPSPLLPPQCTGDGQPCCQPPPSPPDPPSPVQQALEDAPEVLRVSRNAAQHTQRLNTTTAIAAPSPLCTSPMHIPGM